jgi:hypothetical protein
VRCVWRNLCAAGVESGLRGIELFGKAKHIYLLPKILGVQPEDNSRGNL